ARDLVRTIATRMPADTRPRLLQGKTGIILAELLADARKAAADEKRPAAARAAAVRTLGLAAFKDVQALLADLLASRQPPEVQTAAVETLARFDTPAVAAALLRAWPGMSPKLRATAAEALFARPAWINAFLDAVEKGTVGRGDVEPARLDLLKKYPD